MTGGDRETTTGLAVQGAVELGVPLRGAQREASIARGGNGTVARFSGGYLRAATPDDAGLRGDAMSLCMRLRDPTGRWQAPLFARDDRGDPLAEILYGTDGAAKPAHYGSAGEPGPATPWYHLFAEEGGPCRLAGTRALLEYRWRTRPAAAVIRFNERRDAGDPILAEARAGVLHLGVPVALIGASEWHDVVFRFNGPNLELFVDGVLVDEEWGYGALHRFEPPFLVGAAWHDGELATGFHGQVDHVALWERALSDAEIAHLSGGTAAVEQRAVEILGPERPVPHHWRPRGYNAYAGDCMLLWDGARLHLFYLFDRRHHTSKWNLGAHQYAHLSSADLVHWERHPLAIPLSHTWECAIGTGDFLHHAGRYHAFYTDCGGRCQFEDKPHRGSGVFHAVSSDGIRFRKDPAPVVPTTDTGCADCSIFHDQDSGAFHLLTQERSAAGALQVAHYRSTDLAAWQREAEPFLPAGTMGACPHLFAWNGWHYFAMANRLWRSRALAGPWREQTPPPLAGLNFPKTAPFAGGRLLTAGWIGHAGWGGDLLFRAGAVPGRQPGHQVRGGDDPGQRPAAGAAPGVAARRDDVGRPPPAHGSNGCPGHVCPHDRGSGRRPNPPPRRCGRRHVRRAAHRCRRQRGRRTGGSAPAVRGNLRSPRAPLIGRRATGAAAGGGTGPSLHPRPVRDRWHRRPVHRRSLHGRRAPCRFRRS